MFELVQPPHLCVEVVRSGVDLITVKDLLGHYSVRTTERYTHSNQEQKRKAVELLNVQTSGKKDKKVVNLSPICHMDGAVFP